MSGTKKKDDGDFVPFEGKRVAYDTSYYGYDRLFCKKCYLEIDKSSHEAVSRMVEGFELIREKWKGLKRFYISD